MHELSIALSILELAEEEGERRGVRVAAIHLRLGRFSGVVKDALACAYEMAREGTALAQTELVIDEVPLVVHCSACAADFRVEGGGWRVEGTVNSLPSTLHPLPSTEFIPASPYELRCPVCGALTNEIVRGRELEVHALEIES